jgi:DNA-binding IclR family transcriptional regulator
MAGNSADTGRSVASKVIAILLTFTNGSVFSLSEIARLTGLPISTAHRLSTEMAAWGVLERTDDGHYRIGEQVRVIGSEPAVPPASVREKARRIMEDLASATSRAKVRLGVLDDLHVAFVEKLAGSRPVSMFVESATAPVHATAMGKALLAFSPPEMVERVIAGGLPRFTAFTLTSPERFRRSLGVTRLTRVAVSRRELELESSAVAVPVFGPGGGVTAALELEVNDPRDLRQMQAPLVVAARTLSRDLATTRGNGYLVRPFVDHCPAYSETSGTQHDVMPFQQRLVPAPQRLSPAQQRLIPAHQRLAPHQQRLIPRQRLGPGNL